MQSKTNYITAVSKKLSLVHIVVLFIIYVLFSWVVAGPGMLHFEMDVRLPAHISGKPLLQIIYDTKSMNIGSWEARQLSYFFDIIDGKFVAFCIRHGFPHFRSLTHFVFTLILMLYLWSFLTHILRLDRLLSLLLIALLLTTPSFIYSYYYRTSKIGVTLFVAILLGEIYKLIKGEIYLDIKIKKPFWLLLIFLFTTLGLMLFDVLGGFFATAIIVYLFFVLLYKPDLNKSAALAGMLIGFAIWVLYFLYWGPAIMFAITGQIANASYLNSAPFQYFPGFLLLATPPFIVDMVRYLFGYIPQVGGSILLLLLFTTTLWLSIKWKKASAPSLPGTLVSHPKERRRRVSNLRSLISQFEPVLSLLFTLTSIAFIYALLVTRHAPILWPNVRPTYYIMPAQAVLLFNLATLLAHAKIKWMFKSPAIRYFAITLIFFALLGNGSGSFQIKNVLYPRNGDNTETYPHDPELIDSLAHINSISFEPNENIATDSIYQLFSKP